MKACPKRHLKTLGFWVEIGFLNAKMYVYGAMTVGLDGGRQNLDA